MPETEKRPYHHGDLRQTVIDTAMEVLNEDDGWQFTLREIARRAGVSHAAPYKHFPEKAALLAEIALIGFDRLREALLAAAPASDDFFGVFTARGQAYLEFGRQNPALYRLMFGPELSKIANVHLNERALGAFDTLVDLLERGQAEGFIRKRPVRGQAAGCWSQLHGLTMLMLDGLLLPEKVGKNPIQEAFQTLREGLQA